MTQSPPPARIPDSHKNAFWIYGVTAMVMREPLGVVVRSVSTDGIANRAVQVECLRLAVILLILSRQFLTAGTFFDRVYLGPDSAEKFPRRSYPLDFLTRLMEMLVAVAMATAVGLEAFPQGGLTPFTILTGILLLLEGVWLLVARVARYSTVGEIAPTARANAVAFLLSALLYVAARASRFRPDAADIVFLSVVVLFSAFQLAGQIRSYGRPIS